MSPLGIVVTLAIALIQVMVTPSAGQIACTTAAQSCYDDGMKIIDKSLTTDIETVCGAYSSMNDCLERLKAGRSCTDDSKKVDEIQQKARTEMSGLCNSDYSLTDCGDETNKCLHSYGSGSKDGPTTDKSNYTLTCLDLDSVQACMKMILESEKCSDQSTFIRKRIYSMRAVDVLVLGCDSTCGRSTGNCLTKAVGALGMNTETSDWNSFCMSTKTAKTCIQTASSGQSCDKQTQMPDTLQGFFNDHCVTAQGGATDTKMTDCGAKAKYCYDQQKDAIKTQVDNLNFTQACSLYKKLVPCFNDLKNDELCHKGQNPQLVNITNQAYSVVDGLCGKDGSPSSCAKEITTCRKQLDQFKQDFKNKDANSACPAIAAFESCAREIVGSKICNDKVDAIFTQSLASLSEDELLEGCDGPCGKKVGECTEDIQLVLTVPLTEINWQTYCVRFSQAVRCINGLNTDPDCQSQQTLISKAATSLTSYSSDFCDANGQPSECNLQVQKCASDFKGVSPQSGVDAECKATAKFLECTSDISCQGRLKSFTDNERIFLENQELTNKCPTVGSCEYRLKVCGHHLDEMYKLDKGEHTDEQCALVQTSLGCFNVLDADPACSDEANQITSTLDTINKRIKEKCAGVAIEVSVLLIFACLVLAFKNLFS